MHHHYHHHHHQPSTLHIHPHTRTHTFTHAPTHTRRAVARLLQRIRIHTRTHPADDHRASHSSLIRDSTLGAPISHPDSPTRFISFSRRETFSIVYTRAEAIAGYRTRSRRAANTGGRRPLGGPDVWQTPCCHRDRVFPWRSIRLSRVVTMAAALRRTTSVRPRVRNEMRPSPTSSAARRRRAAARP